MRDLLTHRDAMGTPSAVLSVSDSRYALMLAAGMGKTVPVPNDAKTVLFASTGPFWVQYGAAAVLPVTDDVSGARPNWPRQRADWTERHCWAGRPVRLHRLPDLLRVMP